MSSYERIEMTSQDHSASLLCCQEMIWLILSNRLTSYAEIIESARLIQQAVTTHMPNFVSLLLQNDRWSRGGNITATGDWGTFLTERTGKRNRLISLRVDGVETLRRENELQIFHFDKKQVRIVESDGLLWWVAKDVCDVLAHSNSRVAIASLDPDEKGVRKVYTLGGEQDMTVINESGLYSLILRSNKPEAKRFRKWVTSEVLPSLRQTGRYEITAPKGGIARTETISELSIEARKVAVREKYAEARKLEAIAKSTKQLRALAKEHGAALPPGFIEKIADLGA